MRARTALHHLRQDGRPAAAYTHEFQSHLRLASDIDATTTIHYFVSGLDETIRLQVRLADPKSLDEAILKATKVDDILREDKGKVASPKAIPTLSSNPFAYTHELMSNLRLASDIDSAPFPLNVLQSAKDPKRNPRRLCC